MRASFGSLAVTVLAAAGIVQVTALILVALYRERAWQQEILETRSRVSGLAREVQDLSDVARHAASDAAYLEMLARRQGFVRSNERVIVPAPDAERGGP